MKVLTFSTLFPNSAQLNHAVFVKHRMATVRRCCNVDLRVVAPVPYFPALPCRMSDRWQNFAKVPRNETIDGIPVAHPRYLVTPKIGMTLYGYSMFLGALREVTRIHKEFPFDIIDAHYIYPDGVAAVLLGRTFGKPVVLSARGTDINFFPRLRLINPLIRRTLAQADHLISVCGSLGDLMADLGASREKISVIPNGIDPEAFMPMDRLAARKKLGIGPEAKVLLSVGALIERKGMHLLIEAVADIKRQGRLDFDCFIVGKGEDRERLQRAITSHALQDRVRLVGEVNNADLATWYNAADLSFLGSSREGWPNVVSESLACGTPVIATPANGIPEIIKTDDFGLIVERDVQAFAEGILAGFGRAWDRKRIESYGQSRPWSVVAKEVHGVFEQVLASRKSAGAKAA